MTVQMFSFGSILILLIHFVSCHGSSILTKAAIDVNNLQNPSLSYTLLASQGDFGLYPPMKAENNVPMISLRPPDDDPLLCNEANAIANYTQPSDKYIRSKKVVVMVPRGTCSFERKALSAQTTRFELHKPYRRSYASIRNVLKSCKHLDKIERNIKYFLH